MREEMLTKIQERVPFVTADNLTAFMALLEGALLLRRVGRDDEFEMDGWRVWLSKDVSLSDGLALSTLDIQDIHAERIL